MHHRNENPPAKSMAAFMNSASRRIGSSTSSSSKTCHRSFQSSKNLLSILARLISFLCANLTWISSNGSSHIHAVPYAFLWRLCFASSCMYSSEALVLTTLVGNCAEGDNSSPEFAIPSIMVLPASILIAIQCWKEETQRCLHRAQEWNICTVLFCLPFVFVSLFLSATTSKHNMHAWWINISATVKWERVSIHSTHDFRACCLSWTSFWKYFTFFFLKVPN